MIFDTDTLKEKYLNAIKQSWLTTKTTFPVFLCEISQDNKTANEAYLDHTRRVFQEHLNLIPKTPWKRKKWAQNLQSLIDQILYQETVINLHSSMEREELTLFQTELKEFLRQVRKFSPELSFEDMGQALRNYIVYAMFKRIHMDPSGFNRAGFGYSMLYPFTDNFIDNIATTAEEKKEFNQIIRTKLKGNAALSRTTHQKRTCELLEEIESVYPRASYPMMPQLLLMMLDAQELSLVQQDNTTSLSLDDRMNISIYKGGISVLIDRYFVNRELTESDLLFYTGMGFFLQLADDLQDIEEDSRLGYQTLFTFDLNPAYEENLVNQLLHFVHNIMESYQAENNRFKDFVLLNCYQLIYLSIIRSKAFFTSGYLERIERLLPVTVRYYDNLKKDMPNGLDGTYQNKYRKTLDALLLA